MSTISTPEATSNIKESEWYNWSYQELCLEKGELYAFDKVQMYEQLSKQFEACESFIVHNCLLLASFKESCIKS
ncbi:hypothetical protein C1N53_21915 [Pontibacter sp. SGAir0037]|nr:hypothetical protein C1N53_21915 [Pontibacter sp. SGAir0037]